MTKAVTEWEYRGIDLTTVAYDVRLLGAPEQVPARRGDNLAIPGKTGRFLTSAKPLDERRLTLAMFVDAQPSTGGTRSGSQLWENMEVLKKVFALDGPGTLKAKNMGGTGANGTTRVATVEVINQVDFDPGGPWHYGIAVEFVFADPFWYAEQATTVGPTNITSNPQNIAVNNIGTYKADKATVTLVTPTGGTVIDPKLTVGSYYVEYSGTVASAGTLVISCGSWSATNGTLNVSGDITHDGGLVWLSIPSGSADMAVSASTVIGTPTVTVSWTPAFL